MMLKSEEKKEICDKILGALKIGAILMVDKNEVREVMIEALQKYSKELGESIAYIKAWNEIIEIEKEWDNTHETDYDHLL